MSQLLGFEVKEVENRARRCFAGDREMCDWIGCSLLAVTDRSLVVRATRVHLNRFSVAAPKRSGRLPITRGHFRFDEKAAVVICENEITCLHLDQPV